MIKLKDIPKERLIYACKKRGWHNTDIEALYHWNAKVNEQVKELDQLNHKKNQLDGRSNEAVELKASIKLLKTNLEIAEDKLREQLLQIPNVVHESVPSGMVGLTIKQWKELVTTKPHYSLIENCPPSGARFVCLKGQIATLERCLAQFMMDFLLDQGFVEYAMPYMVKPEFLYNTGHLPKDQQNMFNTGDYYLIPTSEVILMANQANKKFHKLPFKMTSLTDCFRKEAGAAGRDTKGLVRLHQFKKCEMVTLASSEDSYEVLEGMLLTAELMLQKLDIPYRVVLLGAEDMGFCASKTYDIEIPIDGQWREVSSISNCETFQTYGLNIKDRSGKLLHSLNGSALAVGRTLASLLEVHRKENYIQIPECLVPYTRFDRIEL